MSLHGFPRVRVLPSDFDESELTPSEAKVMQLLLDQLPEGSEIFPKIDGLVRHVRREIDFVVTIPDEGVALIEVKNGLSIRDGLWYQWDSAAHQQKPLQLHMQLDGERRLFERLIENYFSRKSAPSPLQFLVAPDLSLEQNAKVPRDIDRGRVIAKGELPRMGEILKKRLHDTQGAADLGFAALGTLREALVARGDSYATYVASSTSRGRTVESLTLEQAFVLDMLDANPRVYIEGGPGTGKTVLAVEQARRLMDRGLRVGVVCYNEGLARHIRLLMSDWSDQPAFVGMIKEDLPAFLGAKIPPPPSDARGRDKYFNKTVPKLLRRAARRLPKSQRFDAWVVDEAQDISESELESLRRTLVERDSGEIHLFGDPRQDVFGVQSEIPWPLARARLMFNVRCAPSIAALLNALVPEAATRVVGDTGRRRPAFVLTDDYETIGAAVSEVESALIELHWSERDIAAISTGPRLEKHEAARALSDYWQGFFTQDLVFHGSTRSFKGLERPALILALNEVDPTPEALKAALFVGAGRARDELIVVMTKNDFAKLGDIAEFMVDYHAGWL